MPLFGLIPEITSTVQLKLTPAEAQKEAVGKALSLVGATIGVVGTIMALSVNPAIKQQAEGAWSKLPKSVQDNKIPVFIGMGLAGAALAYWLVSRSVKKQTDTRYKT